MVSASASPLAVLGGADVGGPHVYIAELSAALARLGHEVVVYTRRTAEGMSGDVVLGPGVRVRPLAAGPAVALSDEDLLPHLPEFAQELRAAWARELPEVVHAYGWTSGMAAVEAARGSGTAVVQTFHGLGTAYRRFRGAADPLAAGRIALERSVAAQATLLIATSTAEQRELRSWGVAAARIRVVPCGVDVARFTPEGPRAPRGERPRILTLGQLRPRKGVETAIRALPAVPDAELVVVGGPEASTVRTDPEAVRLHRLARRLGVADRVCFLGRVPHGEVPALLRSADVVVNVPWDEPCGMSTVEAMACGIPVVASDAGSHRDTVVHEITGVLVPPRDPRALGVRLRSLLHDVVAAESYGIAGADRAAARFSWETVAREVDACCAAALDAAGRSPCLATEALP